MYAFQLTYFVSPSGLCCESFPILVLRLDLGFTSTISLFICCTFFHFFVPKLERIFLKRTHTQSRLRISRAHQIEYDVQTEVFRRKRTKNNVVCIDGFNQMKWFLSNHLHCHFFFFVFMKNAVSYIFCMQNLPNEILCRSDKYIGEIHCAWCGPYCCCCCYRVLLTAKVSSNIFFCVRFR